MFIKNRFSTEAKTLIPECHVSNGNEMVCEMASEDSDWSVSFPPPKWNGIRPTEVVTSAQNHGLLCTV
jgi:hypothetical protein